MKDRFSQLLKKNTYRRLLLYVPAALLALLTGWLIWGNRTLQVTSLTVPVKGLPGSFEGLKIAHVSDLHGRRFGEEQKKLLTAIADEKPDLIAITGDIVDAGEDDFAAAEEFIIGALKIAPVYYVAGNHEAHSPDFEKLLAFMEEEGVILLFDRAEVIVRGEDRLTLLGLSDPYMILREDPDADTNAVLTERLTKLSEEAEGCRLLLSHRPELIDLYAGKAELVLSGHAHGGQIRIPLIGGLFAPGQGLFPKYTAGLHEVSSTRMVISRGLGGPEPRINNRPELLILTLTADA